MEGLAADGRLGESQVPARSGAAGDPSPGAGNPVAAEVREILAPVVEQAGRLLATQPHLLPLVVTKNLSNNVLQCEAYAMDGSDSQPETWAMQRGSLLDLLVGIASSQRLDAVLSVDKPDVDGFRDLLVAALRAGGKDLLADSVEGLTEAQLGEVWEFADCARGIEVDPSWSPRTEVSHRVALGDSVELSGRMDLVLGGPGTGTRGVCVEVKSGSPHATHRGELHFYSLLWTLRTGAEPGALALWYPGSGVAEVPVHGTAVAGAKQVANVLGRLVDIHLGEVPRRRPGPQCAWCGLLTGCAEGNDWLEGRA